MRQVCTNENGETLVETLVAVLISGLAMLMLATAIGSAVHIVTSSKTVFEQYYAANGGLSNLAEHARSVGTATLVIKTSAGDSLATISGVKYYENDFGSHHVYAYGK